MNRTSPTIDKNKNFKGETEDTTKTQRKRPRRNSNTSSSEQSPKALHNDSSHQCITPELIREIIQTELRGILATDVRNVVQKCVREEINNVRLEVTELKTSMDFINHQFEEMRCNLDDKSKQIETLQKENNDLKPLIKDLSFRLAQMEQHARASNIEIFSVPENKSENLKTTIMQLSKVISCPLKEDNIIMCTRTAKVNAESMRPRSIIAKLSSPSLRDEIIAAVIRFNKNNHSDKLNTAHLGIGGEKGPVFVSEHLAPHSKELHKATRLAAKEKNYKFVWVRNGRIFAKKVETSDRLYIKDMDSINRLLV